MAQGILHCGQQFGVVARGGEYQLFAGQSCLRQGGREEILTANEPKNRTGVTRSDPGKKKQCRRIILRICFTRPCFMQGIDAQSCVTQPRVHLWNAERQRRDRGPFRPDRGNGFT